MSGLEDTQQEQTAAAAVVRVSSREEERSTRMSSSSTGSGTALIAAAAIAAGGLLAGLVLKGKNKDKNPAPTSPSKERKTVGSRKTASRGDSASAPSSAAASPAKPATAPAAQQDEESSIGAVAAGAAAGAAVAATAAAAAAAAKAEEAASSAKREEEARAAAAAEAAKHEEAEKAAEAAAAAAQAEAEAKAKAAAEGAQREQEEKTAAAAAAAKAEAQAAKVKAEAEAVAAAKAEAEAEAAAAAKAKSEAEDAAAAQAKLEAEAKAKAEAEAAAAAKAKVEAAAEAVQQAAAKAEAVADKTAAAEQPAEVEANNVVPVSTMPAAAAAAATAASVANGTHSAAAAGPATPAAPAAPAAPSSPDEPEHEESLTDYPVPSLDFEGAPGPDDEMNELEQEARKTSFDAHNFVKDPQKRNFSTASKLQRKALDLVLSEEARGRVRPSLVVACAFALSDMLLAQRKLQETKETLAIAYAASQAAKERGPQVRALMNYAYVVKGEGKKASAQRAYEHALAAARQAYGPVHPMVEKVKYELTAFLASSGQEAAACALLESGADDLLAEAERLEAEEKEQEANGWEKEQEKKENGSETNGAPQAMADPGTGLEHLQSEQQGEGEGEEDQTPSRVARHFAMRNLMNAAGVLDGLKEYERGEALLHKALELSVGQYGEGTMQHLNVVYGLAQHYRRREMLEKSIELHEQVLSIMDEKIEVYDPDLLQNRISILRDTALLLEKVGSPEAAIDYATGALVNAQTLAGLAMGGGRQTTHPMLLPHYLLLAQLKAAIGEEAEAAELNRQANKCRAQVAQARGANGRGQQQQQRGKPAKRAAKGASTSRAGGRRV